MNDDLDVGRNGDVSRNGDAGRNGSATPGGAAGHNGSAPVGDGAGNGTLGAPTGGPVAVAHGTVTEANGSVTTAPDPYLIGPDFRPPLPSGPPAARRSPKRLVFAALLAVVTIAAAVVTARALSSTSGSTFSGVIQPAHGQVDVNFANLGQLTQLDVQPGEHVRAGQVLARQDPTVATANLEAAQAAVAADRAQIVELQSPQLSAAQTAQLDASVQQAHEALFAAGVAEGDANSVAGTDIAQAQTALSGAQSVLANDQTAGLSNELVRDEAAVSNAQAALTHEQALSQQLRDTASSAVSTSTLAVQLAERQVSLAASPGTPAQVAAAQAQLAKDQAQVVLDQEAMSQLTLVAPADSVVTAVNGSVGDLVGNLGVHMFGSPQSQATSTPSFSLFPAPPLSPSQSTTEQYSSLISLYPVGGMQAVAQVPESAIPSIHQGERATVTVNATGQSFGARVLRVIPTPVSQAGTVTYDVVLSIPRSRGGLVPGMSASVVMAS